MSAFLRLAEQILDVACGPADDGGEHFIVFDHSGGMRMVESQGWSLAGLSAECGAREIFRVERLAGTVRVEGWSRSERCLIQRQRPAHRLAPLYSYPTTFQLLPQPGL
ncbi:MAG: hypothetical protein ABSG41_19270 [Bryobacteraceae bacterium]